MLNTDPKPSFVISLDFELFWGVIRSRSIDNYQRNVLGVKDAIPSILNVFSKYEIRATWATVGGILCNDFKQWESLINDYYFDKSIYSNKDIRSVIKKNSRLFFSRELVQMIRHTSGQELASHTFGHYDQVHSESLLDNFRKDMLLNNMIMNEYGIHPKSIVFPRNTINVQLVNILPEFGIKTYRGNQDHFLYREGDIVPFGILGKGIRYLDSAFNISGSNISSVSMFDEVINVPSTYFLRPIAGFNTKSILNRCRLNRIKSEMTIAAKTSSTFHLWWHPHNFGLQLNENIYFLEKIIEHFFVLKKEYGMVSMNMRDFI